MANFCRDCTIEYFGEEYADRNDLRWETLDEDDIFFDICEGCGGGWFDRDGIRFSIAVGEDGA